MRLLGINKKPWRLKKKVLPQNTDHAGVMWHGAYVNWLEELRIKALLEVGVPYEKLSMQGFEMPVVELRIKYISALQHGDEVVLESLILERKGLRLPWKTRFLKNGHKLSAEAEVELVLVRKEQKGITLMRETPVHISEAIQKLQEGPE